MPIQSQAQIAEKLVLQLRHLNPSMAGNIGSPERLILDVVSGAIAEDSIDLIGLQEALNVDTKFGVNLTNFLSLFGFARQEATKAKGFVVFKLSAPANRPIKINAGTIVKSSETTTLEGEIPEYETTASVTIRPGETESANVPIEALRPGAFGNVAANKITVFLNHEVGPLLGVTGVTNPAPTSGGKDQEDDNSLKTRFKNTVFRNMAGTEDQYLALAISTAFTTKANVVGPVSKYQEYVQVPENEESPLTGDDTTAIRFGGEGGAAYVGYPAPFVIRGTIAKGSTVLHVVGDITGVEAGMTVVVYEEGDNPRPIYPVSPKVASVLSSTEIELTTGAPLAVSDGWVTIGTTSPTPFVNKWTTGLSTNPFAKAVFPELFVFISTEESGISKRFFREGADFEFNFPPKLQGDTYRAMLDGTGNDPRVGEGAKQPNVTFINVYTGSEPTALTALAPNSVALLEYSYTSSASRNDPAHNVTNAIDVFIDGQNKQPTSTIFVPPLAPEEFMFNDDPTSKFYVENYRRDGEPATRPEEGNILTTLFNEPLLSIPSQVTIEKDVFYLGTHYWLVHDVSGLGGSIRARDGIEWSNTIPGDHNSEFGRPKPGEELNYTGKLFAEYGPTHTPIKLENYTYDENVPDLQTALDGSRQVTTDCLAHSAKKRFFKLDVTVVYSPKVSVSTVNENIGKAIERFFSNQFFGSVIRLSDLLAQIHNVPGVQNVRWSNDVPHSRDLIRVFETDNEGKPLRGIFAKRIQWGEGGKAPIDHLFIVGNPTEGQFALQYAVAHEPYLHAASFTQLELEKALNEHWLPGAPTGRKVTVVEDVRSTFGVRSPVRSFRLDYNEPNESLAFPKTVYNPEFPLQGGEYIYDQDFFLHDDELPALPEGKQEGDTVPGLIIRPRAQNVFEKA